MSQDLLDREITKEFSSIRAEMNASHKRTDEKLDKILSQTTKTNGRVSMLELWKSYLVGSWVIISLFVIPLIIYINNVKYEQFNKEIANHQDEINQLLDK